MNWLLLAIPPIAGSIIGHALTKGVSDPKEKVLTFWAVWSGSSALIHALLNLQANVIVVYPLLGATTAVFMVRGLERFKRERRNR